MWLRPWAAEGSRAGDGARSFRAITAGAGRGSGLGDAWALTGLTLCPAINPTMAVTSTALAGENTPMPGRARRHRCWVAAASTSLTSDNVARAHAAQPMVVITARTRLPSSTVVHSRDQSRDV